MAARRNDDWRRAAGRLLAGVVLATNARLAARRSASAAVTANFSPTSGVLTVFGDALDTDQP